MTKRNGLHSVGTPDRVRLPDLAQASLANCVTAIQDAQQEYIRQLAAMALAHGFSGPFAYSPKDGCLYVPEPEAEPAPATS